MMIQSVEEPSVCAISLSSSSSQRASIAPTVLDSPTSSEDGSRRSRSRSASVASGFLGTTEEVVHHDTGKPSSSVTNDLVVWPMTPPEEWYRLNGSEEPHDDDEPPKQKATRQPMMMIRHEIRQVSGQEDSPCSFLCGMPLNTKRALVREMITDMHDSLRPEAEARLDAVVANPCILLMSMMKSPFEVIKQIISIRREFYIGITERPCERFRDHQSAGYSKMALWMHMSSRSSAATERALIAAHRSSPLMRNIGPGGERASCAQPHFLYIVVVKH